MKALQGINNPVLYSIRLRNRYSAKAMSKPVNFFCIAPQAKAVSLVGDFNLWDSDANPMTRQPDGSWRAQVSLHHGYHQYLFLVDNEQTLDPLAHGIMRNDRNERVCLMAVS